MDFGKAPRDNDLLTLFVIGLIRTSRQSFVSHVGIGSTAQKALDDLFQQLSDTVPVNGSNVSIMDMQDSSTNGLEWNSLCIFNICWQKKLLKQWAMTLSELILFGRTVWLLGDTFFHNTENSPLISLGCFYLFIIIIKFNRANDIFNWNFSDLEHFIMNTHTGPDPQLLRIPSVSLCSLYFLIVAWKHWS